MIKLRQLGFLNAKLNTAKSGEITCFLIFFNSFILSINIMFINIHFVYYIVK